MTDKFRAVARRSYLDMGIPRVAREVIGVYPDHAQPPPETIERPLALCSTYAEARRIRQSFHGLNGQCLIRFVGSTGGGD